MIKYYFILCIVSRLFNDVNGGASRPPSRAPTTSAPTVAPFDYSCVHATSWFLNQNNAYSSNFDTSVDITTSGFVNSTASTTGWKTTFPGIPYYGHTFSTAEISKLNSRPDAANDFITGQTTAVAGNWYDFGDNIGYTTHQCSTGYWPPGPGCPAAYSGTYTFPVFPSPEMRSQGCYVPAHSGYFVNGVPFWSWTDANSYNDEDVWYNSAMSFEQYDLDVCLGHSANNVYHHHSVSPCLMSELNDDGTAHSPLHGFAYDGYPVYGPWQASDILAVSCWQTRDYSSAETGCVGGGRTCLLNDMYNISEGTTTASSAGPTTDQTTITSSGNYINATSGVFFEDYYFNSSCSTQGAQYLDSHNGHTHGSYGYHYHLTMDSSYIPTFPYTMGPKYYGCLISGSCQAQPMNGQATSTCQTTPTQAAGACTSFISSPYVAISVTTSTAPSRSPTLKPTPNPTVSPTTAAPQPTVASSEAPSGPSVPPTEEPSVVPTITPTRNPTSSPVAPSRSDSSSSSANSIGGMSTSALGGIAAGGGVVLVVLFIIFYYFCMKGAKLGRGEFKSTVEMSAVPTIDVEEGNGSNSGNRNSNKANRDSKGSSNSSNRVSSSSEGGSGAAKGRVVSMNNPAKRPQSKKKAQKLTGEGDVDFTDVYPQQG